MEEQIQIPDKFKKIIEEIEKMTVLDLAQLIKILEKKFGVVATPMIAPAPSQPAPAPVQEKKFFNVVLTSAGEKKIEAIKLIKEITGKGLKESKDLVDSSEKEPQIIKENVKKEEAEELKKKLEEIGAKVAIE